MTTDQVSLFEDQRPADPPPHIVAFVSGLLKQHTAGNRKLTTVERIDVDQIARQALRDVAARLA